MATTLILLGAFWILYSIVMPMAARANAYSHAAAFMSDLHEWALEKVQEGKLKDDDIDDIFPRGDSIRFGGENPKKNFHEMISDISVSSAPPVYPGIVAVIIGLLGLVSSFTDKRKRIAEQAASSNR